MDIATFLMTLHQVNKDSIFNTKSEANSGPEGLKKSYNTEMKCLSTTPCKIYNHISIFGAS
jgi:hypothetical protein